MVLSCDFVIAADTAQLCMTYIHRGLIPDGGGMYFLPRRVGLERAQELIFSCRRVAAAEALAIGMIDRVAEPAALLPQAPDWAEALSHDSPTELALSQPTLTQAFHLGRHHASPQHSPA